MSFIIGEEIKKRVKRKGLKNKAFADAMNMEERNLYHFFKKEQMDVDQLLLASEILEYDFIKLFIENSKYHKYISSKQSLTNSAKQDVAVELPLEEHQISFSIKLQGSMEAITSEMSNLLQIIKSEAEQRGIHLI